jgi:hypothetical protein
MEKDGCGGVRLSSSYSKKHKIGGLWSKPSQAKKVKPYLQNNQSNKGW